MDNQNQANNQFGNQPKKDEPTADVTSSSPVEVEPATDNTAMPTPPPVSTPSPVQPTATPPTAPVQPVGMPTQPEEEKKLEMGTQPELLEAPKKKNPMLIAGIAVVLVIALAFLGMVVYNALY